MIGGGNHFMISIIKIFYKILERKGKESEKQKSL
jgi:hypothetical protein